MSNREDHEMGHSICELAKAAESLAHSICEFGGVLKDEMQWRRSHDHLSKQDLQEMEKRLMDASEEIIEFLKEETITREKDSKSIDAIKADMKVVKDKLNAALATAGLSDAARKAIGEAKTAAQQQSAKLEAFDAETDPEIPPIPDLPPVDPNAPPVDPDAPIDPNSPSERLRRNR